MVRPTSSFNRSLGYSLIELMVVLTMIGIFAGMVFYGLGAFRSGEPVALAQAQLLSDLRAMQNRVNNGASGDPFEMMVFTPGQGDRYYIYTGYQAYSNGYGGLSNIQTRFFPQGATFGIVVNPPDTGETGRLCIVNQNFLVSHPTGFDNKWFFCGAQPDLVTHNPPNPTSCGVSGTALGKYLWCQGGAIGLGTSAQGYYFNSSTGNPPFYVSIKFKSANGSLSNAVIVEGNGIFVTNIYAQ